MQHQNKRQIRKWDGGNNSCLKTWTNALGVPVEFQNRETLIKSPVTSMRAYGTHSQKAGTWSDDTSMTLCFIDSLSKGLDY